MVGTPGEFKPLILDASNRLYLHRYWKHEQTLAAALRDRIHRRPALAIPAPTLRESLDRLFPNSGAGPDDQKLAAWMAATRGLTVITGGPGTGKTRTVVWMLAALLEARGTEPLEIAICAPTGKAASRIAESILKAQAELPCSDAVKARLPRTATTLHRLLGTIPFSPRFRRDAGNPLTADVVVVDEASMVDLALMTRLVQALRPGARLVLVGDKDQLASVEAGNVLGELCGQAARRLYSRETAMEAAAGAGVVLSPDEVGDQSAGLADCIVELRRNWRFGSQSGLSTLSAAINAGEVEGVRRQLNEGHAVHRPLPSPPRLAAELALHIGEALRSQMRERDPLAALAAAARFRVLTAVRKGPFGMESINAACEALLRADGLIAGTGAWYAGRPVMVTRNDAELRLFNGDVGVCLPDPEAGGELRVFFADSEGRLRSLPPSRLPEHETVFAMTVHKSQGSEFDRVLLVLPDRDSPLLTRELIYTAVTRARSGVEVWSTPAVLQAAILRRTDRASGLRDTLWQ
jgi:exodeoxyribonuclease V alpha subunit